MRRRTRNDPDHRATSNHPASLPSASAPANLFPRRTLAGIVAGSALLLLAGFSGFSVNDATAGQHLATPGPGAMASHQPIQEPPPVSFAEDVLPIFEKRCTSCHGDVGPDGEPRTEEELDLTTYEGVIAGSTWGTVVEPGDSDGSVLVDMIANGDMPSQDDGEAERVPAEEVDLVRRWIDEGAENN